MNFASLPDDEWVIKQFEKCVSEYIQREVGHCTVKPCVFCNSSVSSSPVTVKHGAVLLTLKGLVCGVLWMS